MLGIFFNPNGTKISKNIAKDKKKLIMKNCTMLMSLLLRYGGGDEI
jgi:hypothetical protein